jgi:glycosyltransferase involved in cell wall biosynthesis
MAHPAKLAVILPVYNPQTGWDILVVTRYREMKKYIPAIFTELVIVNDGSAGAEYKRGIKNIATEIKEAKVFEYPGNKGKGYALRHGVNITEADYFILTDIDLPYTAESMLAVFNSMNKGAGIAIGTRDNKYYNHVSWYRAGLSKMLRFFIRNFLKVPFDDTQCGLKGFTDNGKAVFLSTKINRYLFDLEFIILAVRNKKVSIEAVPVLLRPGIHLSKMPVKILIQEMGNFLKLLFFKK